MPHHFLTLPSLSQQEFGSGGEETIKVSLRTQLRQCQDRLKFLETALRHHHVHAHHILTGEGREDLCFH